MIVVPWRDKGDPHRKANFDHVLDRLLDADVGEVLVCDDGRTHGPFNRSAAYNAGRNHRPLADAYIWHEADMLIPPEHLNHAVRLALDEPGLVVPFQTYAYLSESCSADILDHRPMVGLRCDYVMTDGRAVGAVGVTSAATMRAVGQWDEHFQGWGYDDRAMARAFEVATGHPTRYVAGFGHHLWHPPGWSSESRFAGGSPDISIDERQATEANRRRYHRYKQAHTSAQIRALTR